MLEMREHQKHVKAAEDVKGSFTPLTCSADGVTQKTISESLFRKWGKPYSKVKEWVCV